MFGGIHIFYEVHQTIIKCSFRTFLSKSQKMIFFQISFFTSIYKALRESKIFNEWFKPL